MVQSYSTVCLPKHRTPTTNRRARRATLLTHYTCVLKAPGLKASGIIQAGLVYHVLT